MRLLISAVLLCGVALAAKKPELPVMDGVVTTIESQHVGISVCVWWRYTIRGESAQYQAENYSCGGFKNRKQKFTSIGEPVRFYVRGSQIGIVEGSSIAWINLVKQEKIP